VKKTCATLEEHSGTNELHEREKPPCLPVSSRCLRIHETSSGSFFAAYNERVVAFLRQPNIMDIMKERQPNVTSSRSLSNKINRIRNDGVEILERLAGDMDVNILLRYASIILQIIILLNYIFLQFI
jgi:hypothetical protein